MRSCTKPRWPQTPSPDAPSLALQGQLSYQDGKWMCCREGENGAGVLSTYTREAPQLPGLNLAVPAHPNIQWMI
jgi:hypothetical protein